MEDEVFKSLTKIGCSRNTLSVIRNILNALGERKATFSFCPEIYIDGNTFHSVYRDYIFISFCGNPNHRYSYISVPVDLSEKQIKVERNRFVSYRNAKEAAKIIKDAWKERFPNLEEDDLPERWSEHGCY